MKNLICRLGTTSKNTAKGILGGLIFYFGHVPGSLRFIFLAAAVEAQAIAMPHVPLLPAHQGLPILTRHGSSLSASVVRRIWAPPLVHLPSARAG